LRLEDIDVLPADGYRLKEKIEYCGALPADGGGLEQERECPFHWIAYVAPIARFKRGSCGC